MSDPSDAPIRSPEELLEPFRASCKPRGRFRVGTEAEKFGVCVDTKGPIPYEGRRSIRRVLERLVERHGWASESEVAGGPILALRRGDASITLEPGGQLELSGAPLPSIHMTHAELYGHMAELAEPSEELGIAWLGLGFHPFATREQFAWVPKLRYGIMREYLPRKGSRALDMMLRTATVQANFDYEDEDDAIAKLRVGFAASPFVTALFANSPIVEGKPSGMKSARAYTWLDVDPDRSGILEAAFQDGFGFSGWVEWALDVPMFLIKRDGQAISNTQQTFRTFLRDGLGPHRATLSDWELHLNTLFPEVRLKRTLEMRGADSVPTAMLCALPAFWKGILYDPTSLANAHRLLEGITSEERTRLRHDVAVHALDAPFRGGRVADIATELVELARTGLVRLGCLSRERHDESVHLRELIRLVEAGECPADVVLRRWKEGTADVASLLEIARL